MPETEGDACISRVLREVHTQTRLPLAENMWISLGMFYACTPGLSMGMNEGKLKWALLALVVILGLGLLWIPPLPRQKALPQRIHSVNHVASVSFTIPVTNTPPAATSNNEK